MASASPTETYDQKIQSLQHSVLFLQQHHAKTLEGLQQEISRLQQKCSALTFQLAQVSGPSPVPDASGSSLKDVLQKEIRELRLENVKLTGIIDIKDKRILLLEGQHKSREQKHQDDLKNVQRKISELNLELEQKSTTVAYLTTQLYQMKSKHRKHETSNYTTESGDIVSAEFFPLPPQGTPSHRSKYNLRRTSASPAAAANVSGMIQSKSSHQLVASDHVLESSLPKTNSTRFSTRYKQSITNPARPAVGHSHSKRERGLQLATNTKPKPSDYEDFIAISQSQEVISKHAIEPLPPITTRSGRQLKDASIKSRTRAAKSKATASSMGEVETIIIDNQLMSPDRGYRIQNSSTK